MYCCLYKRVFSTCVRSTLFSLINNSAYEDEFQWTYDQWHDLMVTDITISYVTMTLCTWAQNILNATPIPLPHNSHSARTPHLTVHYISRILYPISLRSFHKASIPSKSSSNHHRDEGSLDICINQKVHVHSFALLTGLIT